MVDAVTRKPLHVSGIGSTRTFIKVLVSQVPEVGQLLDQHQIGYVVDEISISWDGGPATTVIHLDRSKDAPAVQALLDGVH